MGLHSTDWFQKTGPILATSSCQLPQAKSSLEIATVFHLHSVFAENALCLFATQRNCVQVDANAGFVVAIVPRGVQQLDRTTTDDSAVRQNHTMQCSRKGEEKV